MKVVVGLGNPGVRYEKTRHNVGFVVIDRLVGEEGEFGNESKFKAEVCRVEEALYVKPQTFMNESGYAVSKIVNFYKVAMDDLIVVHDDLDIKLGEYKVQKGVGPKVHNGVNDIEERLGKSDFWRVRMGIDGRGEIGYMNEYKVEGEEYVLSDFSGSEESVIGGVVGKVVGEVREMIVG